MSRLSASLSCDTDSFRNKIRFASDIIKYLVRNKGEQWCHGKIVQWNIKEYFYIFNNISDHVTLVQLIDTSGNVYHAVIITGSRI